MHSSQPGFRVSKRNPKSGSNTKSFGETTNINHTGWYSRNFQPSLIGGGVYLCGHRYANGQMPRKSDDWMEINRRLTRPRSLLPPSRSSEREYERLVPMNTGVIKERQRALLVIPTIEGNIWNAGCVLGGMPFTSLGHLTDGTPVAGNLDGYYGARPEQYDRRVRDQLSGHIIHSTQGDLSIASNFFFTVKGPNRSAIETKTTGLLRRCNRSERNARPAAMSSKAFNLGQPCLHRFVYLPRWHSQDIYQPRQSVPGVGLNITCTN
jgi:hypothetical protein